MKLAIILSATAALLGSSSLASAELYAPSFAPAAHRSIVTPDWQGEFSGAPFAERCGPGVYGSSAQTCGDATGGPVGGPNQS